MSIQISDKFDCKKLLRFTMPSIIMMIFTSIYSVVDGFFVSNFVGKVPFTAVNFIMPFLLILGTVGFMFGTGGSALISKTIGEGDRLKANRIFSLLVYASMVCGFIFAILGMIFIEPIASFLGAKGQLLKDSVSYGRIILVAIVAYILQFEFQCFFATAQKPKLGLYVTIASGVTNIIFDALLVAVFPFGLKGAAIATALSQCVGGIIALIYFFCPNTSLLRLGKTNLDMGALFKTCINGSSELMSNISMSVVSMLYNVQLLRYAGEDGVAAYGVIMYVNLIFYAAFIGYSVGVAPVIGYNFGAKNHTQLKELLKKSIFIIGIFAAVMFISAEILARPLSLIFVGYDENLLAMTLHAFKIYSFGFIFAGFSIFISSFFTALNDGVVSAIISFMRTLVFQIMAVIIFPLIWQLNGIWFSIVAAEVMALAFSILFLIGKRQKYHY